MKFGYARVSTDNQSLDLQLDALLKAGVERTYSEHESGIRWDRPQFNEMMCQLRQGDVVVVYKLDRLGRSTKQLIDLIDEFNTLGIDFISLQDQIDTTSAMGRFFFRNLASLSELERDLISERTKDGLAAARARGRVGGRPKVEARKVDLAMKMYESKDYSTSEICAAAGISQGTLYKYLKNYHSRQKES